MDDARRRAPPPCTRTSQLVSKAFVKRRLHELTGASRVCEDTVDDAVAAVEALSAVLIDCIREAYDDQVSARRIQFPAENAKLPLHPRHIERALAVLFRTLPTHLKKHLPMEPAWQAPWSQGVTPLDGAPETA